MKRVSNSLDATQTLDVVATYLAALDHLDAYDHQTVGKPNTEAAGVALTYEECRIFIDNMKFAGASPIFGNEKDGSFKSALGAVWEYWQGLPTKYPELEVFESVLMPNHFHALVRIHYRDSNKSHHLGFLMSRFKGGTSFLYGKRIIQVVSQGLPPAGEMSPELSTAFVKKDGAYEKATS